MCGTKSKMEREEKNAEKRRAHNGNREEMEYIEEGCATDSAERIAEKMNEGI